MKRKLTLIPLLIGLIFVMGCASKKKSREVFKVSTEDFSLANIDSLQKWDAIILEENIYTHIKGLPSHPWENFLENSTDVWATTIEEKTLILSDNFKNNSSAIIEYHYSSDARYDLMTECEMWIYSLDATGNIIKKKLDENELVRKRTNDSTGNVHLNINYDTSNKILVRKYTILSRYYRNKKLGEDSQLAQIEPYIFQREIPLLFGTYTILLPHIYTDSPPYDVDYNVVQLGQGDLNINKKNTVESYRVFASSRKLTGGRALQRSTSQSVDSYKAEKVTATVANVMPLAKESNAEPLGIKVIQKGSKD